MSLHRIYVEDLDPAGLKPGQHIEITGDEAHHALSVKRLRADEVVELLNGRGLVSRGSIASVSKRSLAVQIEIVEYQPRPSPEVIIAAPAPKGPRAETMIEQLSQIGVSQWIPLVTEWTVAEPRNKRLAKWRSVTVVESAKQCGRVWTMEIDDPTSLANCLNRADRPQLLLADGAGWPCRQAMRGPEGARPVLLLVGPEGGFSKTERTMINAAGVLPVCLSPHILRIETAAAIGAGMILGAISTGDGSAP